MKFLIVLMSVLAVSYGHEMRIYNHCPFAIWPGLLNNPNKELPLNGGFKLDSYQTRSFGVQNGWAGRIWARTRCEGNGHCETGDCGEYLL